MHIRHDAQCEICLSLVHKLDLPALQTSRVWPRRLDFLFSFKRAFFCLAIDLPRDCSGSLNVCLLIAGVASGSQSFTGVS